MRWAQSWRADPVARAIADRHYNRQKVGAVQFVPPGACNVFVTPAGDALWITSRPYAQYVKHAWAGAWMNSAFRNESGHLSSKTRRKRDPGRCYVRAGWTLLRERTKAGLIVLQLLPGRLPRRRRAARPTQDDCLTMTGEPLR